MFISGNRFASFQGIRYAQPPVGGLRFKSPQPYNGQNLTMDVSGISKISCAQIDSLGVLSGQEDCLLLNIYIPEKAFQTAMPVMAWIHGGSLKHGSNRINTQGIVCPKEKFEQFSSNYLTFLSAERISASSVLHVKMSGMMMIDDD